MNEYNPISRYRNTNLKLKYRGEDKVEERLAVIEITLYEGDKDPKRGRKFKLNINILNECNLHEQLHDLEKLNLFPIDYIWYTKDIDEYENKPREHMRNVGRGTRWLDLCMKLDEEVHLFLSMEKERCIRNGEQ